jgi:glycosyltransferase involved in cell wall biosynthesis
VALEQRLADLGVADRAELCGYVPLDDGLIDRYRRADVLLHVSWTEGVPQILFEAWAAHLPVVATAVGGVLAAAGDAALLVEPGDAAAAAAAVRRAAEDEQLRGRLVAAGALRAASHTTERETARLRALLGSEARPRRRRHRLSAAAGRS